MYTIDGNAMEVQKKPLVVTTTTTTTTTKQIMFDEKILDVNQIRTLLENGEEETHSKRASDRHSFKKPSMLEKQKIKRKRNLSTWNVNETRSKKGNSTKEFSAVAAQQKPKNHRDNSTIYSGKSIDNRKSKLSMSRQNNIDVRPWKEQQLTQDTHDNDEQIQSQDVDTDKYVNGNVFDPNEYEANVMPTSFENFNGIAPEILNILENPDSVMSSYDTAIQHDRHIENVNTLILPQILGDPLLQSTQIGADLIPPVKPVSTRITKRKQINENAADIVNDETKTSSNVQLRTRNRVINYNENIPGRAIAKRRKSKSTVSNKKKSKLVKPQLEVLAEVTNEESQLIQFVDEPKSELPLASPTKNNKSLIDDFNPQPFENDYLSDVQSSQNVNLLQSQGPSESIAKPQNDESIKQGAEAKSTPFKKVLKSTKKESANPRKNYFSAEKKPKTAKLAKKGAIAKEKPTRAQASDATKGKAERAASRKAIPEERSLPNSPIQSLQNEASVNPTEQSFSNDNFEIISSNDKLLTNVSATPNETILSISDTKQSTINMPQKPRAVKTKQAAKKSTSAISGSVNPKQRSKSPVQPEVDENISQEVNENFNAESSHKRFKASLEQVDKSNTSTCTQNNSQTTDQHQLNKIKIYSPSVKSKFKIIAGNKVHITEKNVRKAFPNQLFSFHNKLNMKIDANTELYYVPKGKSPPPKPCTSSFEPDILNVLAERRVSFYAVHKRAQQ